jgi:hypothetical protein
LQRSNFNPNSSLRYVAPPFQAAFPQSSDKREMSMARRGDYGGFRTSRCCCVAVTRTYAEYAEYAEYARLLAHTQGFGTDGTKNDSEQQ